MKKLDLQVDSTSSVWLMVRAYEVARRFVSFKAYNSEEKAANALRRFCKGHYFDEERADALSKAIQLMKVVVVTVESNLDLLHAQSKREDLEFEDWNDTELIDTLTAQVKEQCPAFYSDAYKNPTGIYRFAISWVFFWHHIRGAPIHILSD